MIRAKTAIFATLITVAGGSAAMAAEILYARSAGTLADGRFGPIARFQQALSQQLVACKGPSAAITADGKFGGGTVTAIMKFMTCPNAADLAPDDPARQGKISDTLWRKLLPSVPAPQLDARVQSLVLTYEATDYTQAEWNFCQNRPFFNPANPSSVCHTNDPRSYLTWGPRGATAGHGREVQAIVFLVSQRARPVVEQAFGNETANLDRLIGLSNVSTEKMLCAVWMNPQRRQGWKDAFAKFGEAPETRAAFDEYYRSIRSDGAKIQTFFRLYQLAGVTPSEVDYGFFVDRATHSSAPASSTLPNLAQQIRTFVAGKSNPNAFARLLISRTLLAGNTSQRADRRGRDMAFVMDAFDAGNTLTQQERNDWAARGKFRTSDIGLSEARAVPTFTPTTIDFTQMPSPTSDNLTPDEEDACPSAVLHPSPP